MNTSSFLLQADSINKVFKLYKSPRGRLTEWISFGHKTRHKDFQVLKNINLEIKRGESIGLIGQNGSGKSTLLRILSHALSPTSGSVTTHGRALALISLGTGFSKQLSGRDNIEVVAQMLGFEKEYVKTRSIEIIEFSELGEFIDQPMRVYSSGMSARLAFSLFAFLEPDVLMLDEVLSVGDDAFKQKCLRILDEKINNENRASVIVSHSMNMLSRFCNRIIWLHKGEIIEQGEPSMVIEKYERASKAPALPN